MMADGHRVESAAEALGKGYETIRTQVNQCIHKLGKSNVTGAVAEAWRRGLID